MTIITRFPPSPTGYLHLGGARTALFNWLLARAGGGQFVLRIEDTDQARSTPEMTRAIVEGMSWLGLDWDHGPYLQSDRTDLYTQAVDELLAAGRAYYCECSAKRVEAMRETARAAGEKPRYDGRCREKNLGPGRDRVVRFRAPEGDCRWKDIGRGAMHMSYEEMVDDFVLCRSSGSPVYNLAVVVDDAAMGVTHIVRGEDHLSNTPKQIALYVALGKKVPKFGHIPMIFGEDKKKLSKRHGAMSVMEYEKMGFLPEAMVNYLVRLGWGHGNQEIFSVEELVNVFSARGFSKSPAQFDIKKLTHLNGQYIRKASPAFLAPLLARYLRERGCEAADRALLERIIPLYQPRSTTLVDMAQACAFFLMPDHAIAYDDKAKACLQAAETAHILPAFYQLIAEAEDFSVAVLEALCKEYVEAGALEFKDLAQPVRAALTGTLNSPGIAETMAVLGRVSTLARITKALEEVV